MGRDQSWAGGGTSAAGGREALLASLFDRGPVGVAFIDPTFHLVEANQHFASFAGLPAEALAGAPLTDLSGELAAILTAAVESVLHDGASTVEADVPSGGGDGRRFTAIVFAVGDDPSAGATVVIRDVTEARRASAELTARVREQAGLARYEQRAMLIDDEEVLMTDAVEVLADVLGLELVGVLALDAEAGDFEVMASRGWGDAVGRRVSGDQDLLPGYALASGEPVFVADFGLEDRFRVNPLLKEQHPAGGMSVVIPGPSGPWGVLSAHTATPRAFRPDEIGFVESVAHVLGAAVARVRTAAALAAEQARLRLALDAGGMGDWEWDLSTNELSWSPSLEAIFGLADGSFGGNLDDFVNLVHPDDRTAVGNALRAAVESGADFSAEFRILRPGGREGWIYGTGVVQSDESGSPRRMIGVGTDITERVETAEIRERARERMTFLAEASELLAASLDYHDTLRQVAHLVVVRLADWCTVEIVEDDGADATTIVVAHRDPERVHWAEEMRVRYPPSPNNEQGTKAVIRSGVPQVVNDITDEMLEGAAVDDVHLSLLRELELHSVMVVPLTARGRTLGAISLVASESGRVYDDDDLAFAMDLARRAAIAIDNARLYRERSQVAEALQASLLPPRKPEIPGLEVAARYRPVGRGAEIGGDFYDVFEMANGQWSVVIGDVCGKGTEAAAVTGLARDTIRGVSLRESSPARVLGLLNEALGRREDSVEGQFLTVALSRLDVGEGSVGIRIACAGHPPPLVVSPGGDVREVGRPGLMLGLFDEVDCTDVHAELGRGDTVVFFTDGVIEERGPNGMFGEGRLRELLTSVAGASAEHVAQAVLDAVDGWQPGTPSDDMAIVAIHVPG